MSGFDDAFDEGAFDSPSLAIESTLPAFDYVAHAISRLPHMYRSSNPAQPTNTEKDIAARLAPANDLGTAARAVLTQRTVDNAVGAQLDVLGALVGRKRNGITDDEIYRRHIRAQIAANKSDGVIGDILRVARAVIGAGGTIVNRITGAAAYILEVRDVAVPDDVAAVLVELVLQATSDGVRAVVRWSSVDPGAVGRYGIGVYGVSRYARSTDKEI